LSSSSTKAGAEGWRELGLRHKVEKDTLEVPSVKKTALNGSKIKKPFVAASTETGK